MRPRRLLAYLWVAPVSLIGLALALVAIAAGAQARRVEGQLEVAGARRLRTFGRLPHVRHFAAITLGHVILGRDHATLARWRRHEQAHVRQYERWGVLFWPLYLGSSAWVALRGGDPYVDNVFEVDARRAEALPDGGRAADGSSADCSQSPANRLSPQATSRPSTFRPGESGQSR